MRPVLVVGAGLSGLACAFELRRRGRDVLVFEARERPGGVVGTLEADGFRFETGPNTLSRSASGFRRLCGELGVAERLVPSAPEARARYLWHAGELVPVPLGPCEFLRTPLISGAGKLRALTEPLRRRNPQAPELPEPSLAEFLAERLGPELTRRFAAPFVRGIYAGEIQRLGAESSFPRLWGLVQEHGGIARGLWRRRGAGPRARDLPGPAVPRGRLLSFRHGLRVLVDALDQACL